MIVVERSSGQCSVQVEGWTSDAIAHVRQNRSPQMLHDVLLHMATRMAGLVDKPEEVTLIVAADYAASVFARLPVDERLAADDRTWASAGEGVGCTFAPSEDGHISVVITGTWMTDLLAEARSLDFTEHIDLELLVVHEAQHVLQFQRGSWGGSNDVDENADPFLLSVEDVAAEICDEYGADWHEVRITDIVLNPEKHAMSILKDLDCELHRLAQDYRDTSDFGHLCTQVLDACRKLWLGLEYWSAIYSAVEEPIPDGLLDDTLWDRYVGDTWGRIFAILQTLPIRNLMVDPDEFDSVVKRHITVLLASLDTAGKSLACRLTSAAQVTPPHVRTP